MSIVATLAPRAHRAFQMQAVLLANSGALAAGAFITAALGFAFWWLAARYFSPHAVGLASAAISIMNLIGLIGEFGLSTLLIGESLRNRSETPGLISAALIAALLSSTVFGVIFLVIGSASPLDLGGFLEFSDTGALFIAGCAITGFTLVLDSAFVGLLRSSVPMYRNVAFSVLKLALLVAAAFAAHASGQEVLIFLAWVAGKLLSVLLLVAVLVSRRQPVWCPPGFASLRPRVPRVLSHHLLNIATQAPGLILPFLVTVIFAPEINAAFYAAWMILSVALLVPASLTTMLFTIGVAEPETIAGRLKFSLWLCAIAGIFVIAGFLLLSRPILGLFGASYAAIGAPVLQILGVSFFAVTLKCHYIAVQRLSGRMAQASLLLGIGGCVEVVFAALGGHLGGLTGFTWGWVAAVYLQALLVVPSILRAIRRRDEQDALRTRTALSRPMGRRSLFTILALIASAYPIETRADQGFVSTRGTQFVRDGKPFRVAGANNHYLTFGSAGEVTRVLDDAVALQVNVMRTFIQPVVGSPDGRGMPTIWDWKSKAETSNLGVNGVYMIYWDSARGDMAINDGPSGLQRLDFLLGEARKRNLSMIIAFLDFWDYTGGAQQMRAWYGSDDKHTFFFEDARTKHHYKEFVRHVLNRVNSINGIRYKDDPTIFAWELMNEPNIRPSSLYRSWVAEMTAYVKSIDPNHLVSSGHANMKEKMADLSIPSVDFGTWHGYPLYENITPAQFNSLISEFCAIGRLHSKPVLLEEFGYARSNPDHVAAYRMWLDTLQRNPDCAGWLVWRLVSRQDSGRFPEDRHDQFDIRNDGGELWTVVRNAAARFRTRPEAEASSR
jgi:mannan endo-1,4-beta-mannosidase